MAAPQPVDPRLERVLDAAADLLVRWGYQRVTIDEVARQAGIGKGTVYLHFRSKDALFLTVLLRVQRRISTLTVDRMAADPREVLPSRTMGALLDELATDPVARSLYLGDMEVLGRLIHEAADTLVALAALRQEAVRHHLRLLAEAGCLRSGIDADAALYTFGAVATGFLMIDGFGLADLVPDRAEKARLAEQSIAAAVEATDPPLAGLEQAAPAIVARYRALLVHVDEELGQRVR